jgi:hypothetical protein
MTKLSRRKHLFLFHCTTNDSSQSSHSSCYHCPQLSRLVLNSRQIIPRRIQARCIPVELVNSRDISLFETEYIRESSIRLLPRQVAAVEDEVLRRSRGRHVESVAGKPDGEDLICSRLNVQQGVRVECNTGCRGSSD